MNDATVAPPAPGGVDGDGLLTVTRGARYLGVSASKLRRLIRDGAVTPYASALDERVILVRRSDLDRLRTPIAAVPETSTRSRTR